MGIMGRQSAAMFIMAIGLLFAVGAFIGTFYHIEQGMVEWCKDLCKTLIGAGLIAIQIGGTRTNGTPDVGTPVKN